MYAVGIHKESNGTSLPFFILETRRRVFCHAYNADKQIATFLGRPPRLSKRHTDIKLPLDLADAELTADAPTLAAAISALDAGGWNTAARYHRASWIRLRYLSATIREEILEYSHMPLPLPPSSLSALTALSTQVQSSWDALPPHFRYTPSVWEAGSIPNAVCLMLVVVYLTHFYNEFMIQRILLASATASATAAASAGGPSPTASSSESVPVSVTTHAPLLRVSTALLSASLTTGVSRDRTYDVHRDFLGVVVYFGIPSASVLASALQEQHNTGGYLPAGISRAEIIRLLSVLISHLDVLGKMDRGAKMVDGNYSLWSRAAGVFTRVIDTVLDERPVVQMHGNPGAGVGGGGDGEGDGNFVAAGTGAGTCMIGANAPAPAPMDMSLDLDLDLDMFGGLGMGMGMDALGGMDMWDGIGGIGGIGDEGGAGEWGFGDWTV
jgi:hypothetical protein